ncbi:MAG: hypothetical protein PWQ37_1309 [Candidatus Petromonas sp.]|jgi:hypothetical protein|nr:hypothetical protein [Candidatus Petromonas sp.]
MKKDHGIFVNTNEVIFYDLLDGKPTKRKSKKNKEREIYEKDTFESKTDHFNPSEWID